MDEQPGFFKFFIPEMCSQRMQIPPAFVSDYLRGQRIKKETFITDCRGNVWPMEISVEGEDFFFEKGWVRFVEDNRIDLGEFLVFKFRSDYGFDFKHLGTSACEKEKTSAFRFTVKQEEEEEVTMNNGYRGEEEDNYDEGQEDEDNGDVGVEEGEGDETDEDDGDFEDGEEAEDDETLKVNEKSDEEQKKKKNERESTRGSKKKYNPRHPRIRRADIIEYEEDIFGSGDVPFPKNPYFVVKIRAEKRQELFIPNDVVRDHGLNLPTDIDIVDENGKRWRSKVKVWISGRIALKKGWKAFRKWNHLKTDDKCLFEFVPDRKMNKRQLCLQVRVFRA